MILIRWMDTSLGLCLGTHKLSIDFISIIEPNLITFFHKVKTKGTPQYFDDFFQENKDFSSIPKPKRAKSYFTGSLASNCRRFLVNSKTVCQSVCGRSIKPNRRA